MLQCLCRAALALLPERRGMIGHQVLECVPVEDVGATLERDARHLRQRAGAEGIRIQRGQAVSLALDYEVFQ